MLWMVSDVLFSGTNPLLYNSGGLLRLVMAHRPLHCAETPRVRLVHKNMIESQYPVRSVSFNCFFIP